MPRKNRTVTQTLDLKGSHLHKDNLNRVTKDFQRVSKEFPNRHVYSCVLLGLIFWTAERHLNLMEVQLVTTRIE